MKTPTKDQIAAVSEIAQGAGAILHEHYNAPVHVRHKDYIDLVTDADRASEEYVKEAILKRFGDHGILAEESGTHAPDAPYRWIVDPLDGTVNFAHKIPHFCVLIALQEKVGKAYETIVGVTLDPLRKEEFVAVRGGGASLNGKPIVPTAADQLLGSLGSTGFGYNRLLAQPDNHPEFCRLNLVTQGIRRMGAAGLDLAYVACGRLDFHWEHTLRPWDMAPGILLVQEAGGKVTGLEGQPATVDSGRVLASNGPLHAAVLEALASTPKHPINARQGLERWLPADIAARLPR
jgi:myo-inositol-1(or 4)-monophosphatase